MKNQIVSFLVVVLLTACSSQTPLEVTSLPLEKGTTWVYSYEAYDPAPSDPEQVIHASYQVTDTVVDTETVSDYFVAHVVRNWKLVKADPDWQRDLSSQLREFWYVRDGQQIYQSNLPLDTSNIHPDQLILDYEFPLSNGKSWCLLPDARGAGQSSGCDFVGKRQVTAYGPYTTPAGTFKSCYDLTDSYNGGNILQKFCDGAGIVYTKFDHTGTKFGFEQTLSSLSSGTP